MYQFIHALCAGNIPSNRLDLIEELRKGSASGVLIINTTQCCHGSVSAIYETGAALLEAGGIPGADMVRPINDIESKLRFWTKQQL